MPLYEGIGLVGDKTAVVLDIGSLYTNCGFAGENAPRAIIRSRVLDVENGEHDIFPCNDLQSKYTPAHHQSFIDFIHQIYYKHLLVNSRERRVVLVESVLIPTDLRNMIAQVPSLIFVSSHLMASFPFGTQSALVVDVGYREAIVLPVFEGVPMLNALEVGPFGMKSAHENLKDLLQKCKLSHSDGTVNEISESDVSSLFPCDVLDDIIVRTAFVTHLQRGKKYQALEFDETTELPESPPSVQYPIDGDKVLEISGQVRESVCESIFRPDLDDIALPELVMRSIMKCPIDLRVKMAERIIVIGGTTMITGFMSRLKTELVAKMQDGNSKLHLKSAKFYKNPVPANIMAWVGASIFGALEILPHRSITRDSYLQNPLIPDWTTYRGNYGVEIEPPLR